MDGAGAACQQMGEGAVEDGFEFGGVFQPFGRAERADHGGLIWQFVQEAKPFAKGRTAVDARDDEDRDGIRLGLPHGGERV